MKFLIKDFPLFSTVGGMEEMFTLVGKEDSSSFMKNDLITRYASKLYGIVGIKSNLYSLRQSILRHDENICLKSEFSSPSFHMRSFDLFKLIIRSTEYFHLIKLKLLYGRFCRVE